jgi:acetate kinase
MSCETVENILSKESGLGVLSQQGFHFQNMFSDDSEENNFIREFYQYQILKYIGSCTAVLGGADAVVFIARKDLRAQNFVEGLLKRLPYPGLKRKSPLSLGKMKQFTRKDSSVQAFLLEESLFDFYESE